MKLLFNHPLARKIAIVTVIKMIALLVIWWTFFSAADDNSLTTDQVSNAILHPLSRNRTTP